MDFSLLCMIQRRIKNLNYFASFLKHGFMIMAIDYFSLRLDIGIMFSLLQNLSL
jgi:hypothetical protein